MMQSFSSRFSWRVPVRESFSRIRSRSAQLDTRMEIDGNQGVIAIPPANK
jgi:hypothetical protein